MKTSIWVLLALSLTIFACQLTPRNAESETSEITNLPADFIDFMDTFHTDLDYQLSHIRFPLQGIPAMMDSSYVEGNYFWSSDDWVMHQPFDEDNDEFEQLFSVFDENMIIEKILHINRSMGMERRFAKSDDGWNLIYYAGMNFIRQE